MTNFVLSPTKIRSQSTKTAPNVLSTDQPTKISEIAREQNEDRNYNNSPFTSNFRNQVNATNKNFRNCTRAKRRQKL